MYKVTREKPMKEIVYRESRVARVLGDPAKYAITNLLLRRGPLNGIEIARRVRRSKSTVSHHLSSLRSLEIIRYEAELLLEKYGFKVENVFGDFDRSPYNYRSGEQIFVTRMVS